MKIVRLFKRGWNDLMRPHRFGVGIKDLADPSYYLRFYAEEMEALYDMDRDTNGIIMMRHHLDHSSKETHYYSPVKLAHYILGCIREMQENRKPDYFRAQAILHGDFLVKMAVNDPKLGLVWRTPTSNPRYDLPIGYVSCIAQGVSISALVRLYTLTDDRRYLDTALKATQSLSVPLTEGGLHSPSPWGEFYEEYPCNPPSHVVNGMIFCLFGLRDLSRVTGDARIERMYRTGIETLRNVVRTNIWIYDKWATYDLRHHYDSRHRNLATRHYQYLHADQVMALAIAEKDEELMAVGKRFEKQGNSLIQAAIAYKNKLSAHA